MRRSSPIAKVVKADEGDDLAKKILTAVMGGLGAGVLGLGVGGALILAGLGWLVAENFEEGAE